jgi:predicted small secreted protein
LVPSRKDGKSVIINGANTDTFNHARWIFGSDRAENLSSRKYGGKMNTKRLLFVVVLLSLILAACGGGGGGDGDPVDVAKKVVEAIADLDTDEAKKYICSQHQADLPDAAAEFAELGVDPDEIGEIIQIEMSDMKYEEKSKDGDKAVVHVSGKVSFNVDAEKLKPIIKKLAEEQLGMELGDDMLDPMIEEMLAEMGGEEVFEGDVNLVKEDGKWLICDDFAFLE